VATICLGGIKGGSGKSTLATNLAIIRAHAGYDVLLVDADSQATATDFTALREQRLGEAGYTTVALSGSTVKSQVLRQRGKYDDILIDVGGRDTQSQRAAIAAADLLLIPFVPRSFDIWTIDQVTAMVEEMRPANEKLRVVLCLNKADARGSDNEDAAALLVEKLNGSITLLESRLGNRKAFGNAASEGLAVTELKPADAKAGEEMLELYREVYG
jgi:chromosome partitioning protein